MRALLLVLLFVFGNAYSDNSADHKQITQKNRGADQKNSYASFDTTSLEKTIRESIKEATEKPDPNSKEKLESDRKLVEYTGELSSFTKLLVIATSLLAAIAIWQGVLLKRTVNDARKEFFMAHRPKIIVRGVQIHYGAWQKPDGIEFIILNAGDTTGTMTENPNVNIKPAVYMPQIKGRPSVPPYGGYFVNVEKKIYKPEERHPVFIPSSEINETLMQSLQKGESTLTFFGYLIFEDELGNRRPHAFYWRYIHSSDSFEESQNPDYAY